MNDDVRIRIGVGVTRNLGNFESVRYDVEIEASKLESETIHDATLRIRRKAEAELQDAVNELEAEILATRKRNKTRGG